ncbi:MAG: caspase family protein [Prevotella sp.]|nr:caspase family protein [Prevotella sp.]
MKNRLFSFILLVISTNYADAQIVDTYNYVNDPHHYFIDSKGKRVGRADYDFTWMFEYEKDFGMFEKNGMRGLVNLKGEEIIPGEYNDITSREIEGLGKFFSIRKKINGIWHEGLCDIKGNIIIPCKYLDVNCYKYGITVVDANGKVGVLDYHGKVIIEVKYSNFAAIDEKGDKNILNLGGTNDINNPWHIPRNVHGGKWGVCDDKGTVIVPFEYDGCLEAADNLYAVNRGGEAVTKDGHISYVKGGKWGLYAQGQEIIPCKFDEAPKFVNDVAMVKINGELQTLKNPLKDESKIHIAQNSNFSAKKKKSVGPAASRYPKPDSDVDKNIPVAKKQAETTFAFIICNENYAEAPVPYSLNDGRMFREYCQKALGLPEKNINMYEDATFGNIITAVEKMKSIADAYEGEVSVIFYYAGHGFPDDKQATAYLLPIDGDASSITTTGYSLAKLYKEIASLKLKSSVVFLDACFSGAKREDQMLASSRGVAIKVKDETPQGKMVVFSAAQGDETAHQLEDKHHGLFTYYLLKELQATQGEADLGTLTDYVTKQVKRQSVVINNKKQTPTVIPSQAFQSTWRTIKLK